MSTKKTASGRFAHLDGNDKKTHPSGSSSSKKSKGGDLKSKCVVPGVEIDPLTGKYVFTSYEMKDFEKFVGAQAHNRPTTFSGSKKAYVPDESNPGQPSKYRKSTKGARKELFKAVDSEPKRKKRMSVTCSNARRCLLKNSPNKKMQKGTKVNVMSTISEDQKCNIPICNKKIIQDQSPQLLMDNEVDDENIKTPDSESSEKSFLRMEQLCKTPKVHMESPLGTIRKLFDTKLTLNTRDVPSQSVEIGQNDQSQIIAKLRQVVLLDQKLCQEIAEKQALHLQNLATMKALTDQLAPSDTNADLDNQENKGNHPRRSRRLQTISSPIPLVPKDLRKSVLTSNLVRTGQKSDGGSEQKALDMYNSTRKLCSTLLTPSIKNIKDCEVTNSLRNINMKIHEQCLMIQDTPCKK